MFEYAIEVLDTTIMKIHTRNDMGIIPNAKCKKWVKELEQAIEILKREDSNEKNKPNANS